MEWNISRVLASMVIVVMCVACGNIFEDANVTNDSNHDNGVLTVDFEDADTRTYIDDSCKIHWHADDRVAVFYGNGDNVECRFSGATGDMTGEIKPIATPNNSSAILDAIYALYPYSKGVVLQQEDLMTFTLPSEQTYAENSFGRGANAMVAVSKSLESRSLQFRNMGGSLKLQMWGDAKVKSLRVKGNNNEPLAGSTSVVVGYDVDPELSVASNGGMVVTLACGDGVQLSKSKGVPTTFWVVLPPVTFTKGFTVEVECADGTIFTKSTNKQVAIKRNTIQPMVAFEIAPSAPAKPANNEIWYTTSDGNTITIRNQCFNSSVVSHVKQDDKWIITFSDTLTTIGIQSNWNGAFENSKNLVGVTIPDSVTKIYPCTFYGCSGLKNVVLSANTQLIDEMVFCDCLSLAEITLPERVTTIGSAAFYGCSNLVRVNSLATTPPSLGDELVFPDRVTVYVPDSAIRAYLQHASWKKYTISTLSGEDNDDANMYAPNDPNYISSDYSANGKYVTLQRATEGNGIDIVLMGDGYSDRQVASGRYEADMRKAMEAFFSKEPFTSFRHLFNVYMVKCVSKREGCSNDYAYGETALNCYIKSDGISISGDGSTVYGYAKKIFGEESYEYNDGPRTDESTLIVIMNSDAYAGVCYMTQPKYNTTKNYGNGNALSYFSLCGDDDLFANLLIHEAAGHGFAKLGDEYFSSGNGAITNYYYYEIKDFEQWGWFKNVDATVGDALTEQTIKWKHFLNDYRYATLIGVYEGAYSFAKNAYRPSDNSIMRHVKDSDGIFNAPSREAIYYRIHKLAYGNSWVYDFEDFAEYDVINR